MKKINLAWNGFGLEGSIAFGDALKGNQVLEELDLTYVLKAGLLIKPQKGDNSFQLNLKSDCKAFTNRIFFI